MPRRLRLCPVGMPQHVIQRGNNRQVCFANDEDMAAYANWLYEASNKFQAQIHAWVFMNNHIYLLVTPLVNNGFSKMSFHSDPKYLTLNISLINFWGGVESAQKIANCHRMVR